MAGSGITRSQTNEDVIKFSMPFANTVTYQTSYFIRACITFISSDLHHKDIGLYTFNLRYITNVRYPNVTTRVRGSPYLLNAEGKVAWR